MRCSSQACSGYSLLELIAVTAILGILAGIILPSVTESHADAHVGACLSEKSNIEVQAELWLRNKGSWPAANLANIGADLDYFPAGLPVCPVDGTSYTLDPATGRVVGHNHP
jgi:prepilin-type N-terminal cleavage/methylation domain-containing protein